MAAPKGNRYASKDDNEKLSQALYIRMREAEKEACREAAGNRGLSDWAREVLLTAVCNRTSNIKAANKSREVTS